ncbi:MAG TPA: PfkB family carbohydrate kinase [Solirubrobacterales bacterium]|nr:PfkB family carbohydrate kinase [Solirubrobacterales bacterium]
MKSPKVVCLGVHLLDVLVRHPEAPNLKPGWQLLEDLRITAAGTAAGPAVDLAKLGAQPISIGVIGADFEGNVVCDLMSEHGVDVSRMVRDQGGPTHVSLLFIGADGERNPIMIRPTGARTLTLDDVDMDAVADADVLHVGGADQLGDFVDGPLVELIRHARANDVVVTVDVLAMTDETMRDRLAPALSEAQFFFPNEGQLAEMTGTDDPAEGVALLREKVGVETVIGTLGEEGSLILGPEGEARVPAFEIDLVDTTGCGDAYVAGFIVATANGWDAEAAGWLGSAASGLVATGLGSDSGIVDLPSTLEFMATRAPERIADLARAAA